LLSNDQNELLNRDLAWLEFNRRVLHEAKDSAVPILERAKFLAIFSSNLDEFFMVLVAGLKRQVYTQQLSPAANSTDVASMLNAISRRVHDLTDEQHLCFLDTILPELTREGIHFVRPDEMTGDQEQCLEEFFHKKLYPIVTPLAVDPGHPFPYLTNRSLSLIVSLRSKGSSPLPYTELSIVNIPAQVVPRFLQLPTKEGQYAFMLLEHVLRHYLPRLYQGFDILSAHAIRVTRDAEFGLVRRRERVGLRGGAVAVARGWGGPHQGSCGGGDPDRVPVGDDVDDAGRHAAHDAGGSGA
jgi:polyphosphate kinase